MNNEPFIVASRGRNPENPSDRTVGSPTVQRLEPNSRGIANTLTTVQKDNWVAEPVCLNSKGGRGGVEGLQPSVQDRVYDSEHISTAVTTSYMPNFTHGLRIRKLTPKECYRLMGFDDESFHKAEAVCSNTQLYKQAGNSIVVDVLEHLFVNLKPYLYT